MYQADQGAYWQAQLMFWGPKVLIALLIIVATWIVARAVKWALQKAIDRSPALKKHVTGTPEETVGHQLGVIAKLIIWLVGILAALKFLGIGQILDPINALTLEIFQLVAYVQQRIADERRLHSNAVDRHVRSPASTPGTCP